ncbi:MAG: efflux RND transporter periplasmic adaptor subunit [Flavobacteriales bacterium]|nr:efflux RND transporter periplasmic adaptor subunit [Flavobacteriales bacterium]
MKKLIALTVVLLLTALASVRLFQNKKVLDARKTPPAGFERRIPVKVAAVQEEVWEYRKEKTATLMPWEEVQIMACQPGQVTEVFFETGDPVKAGQLLVETDTRQKELSLRSLQLTLEKLSKDLEKLERLRQGEAISEKDYLDLKFQKENTEIQLQQAQQSLQDSRIKAAISGTVIMKNVRKGEFVNPGVPLGTIADLTRLRVFCKVNAEELQLVRQNQEVLVAMEAPFRDTVVGRVRFINPRADQTQNFSVEVVVPNHDLKWKAGGFVKVLWRVKDSLSRLTAPREAFAGSVAEGKVFVVRDSVAKLRKIIPGRIHEGRVEILSGLQVGENVVIAGHNHLVDGSPVRVVTP